MSKVNKKSKIAKFAKEILAATIWLYIICALLGLRLDTFVLAKYAPTYLPMLNYSFLFVLGTMGISWALMGGKRFLRLLLYVFFYPVVFLCSRVLKKLFLNWERIFVFAPAVYDVVMNFKLCYLRLVLTILSITTILLAPHWVSIAAAMLVLFVLLLVHLNQKFQRAYRSSVFTRLAKLVTRIRKGLEKDAWVKPFLAKKATGPSDGTAPSSEKKGDQATALPTLYIFHWVFEYVRLRLESVVQNKKMDIYLIGSWAYTIAVTVVAYSFLYFGLYKINPASFSPASASFSYWSFLGFSFGKITPSQVSSIIPATTLAEMLCYSELFCSLAILVILIFTILTAARERYKQDVDDILAELSGCTEAIQSSFNSIFSMALNDVEQFLLSDHHAMVNNLRKLRGLPELPVPEKTKQSDASQKAPGEKPPS